MIQGQARKPLTFYEAGQSHSQAVVLLHGGFLLHNTWHPQLQAFSQRWHIIAPDLTYSSFSQLTVANLAHDVTALIQSQARQPVWLVGLSLGAVVATRIAIDHPQLVAGLVLSGGRAKAGFVDKIATTLVRLTPEKSLLNSFLEPTLHIYPALDGIAQKEMQRVGKAGFVQSLRAIEAVDFTAALPGIHVPTLVLVGADDRPHFLREAKSLHDGIPNAELRVIPDVGHGWNLEAPEAFNEIVTTFIEQHTTDQHQTD